MSETPETIWTCDHVGEYGHYFPEAVEAEGEYGGKAIKYRRADIPPTLSADLIRLRAENEAVRASEARMREALTIAETTIADLERANASYQSALSERGIDGSKGTEE